MTDFTSFGLSQPMLGALAKLKFSQPTPIQAKAIPFALSGRDILGVAQTGTGKTFAFGIPLIEGLLADPNASALILTPTRELAAQVMKALESLLSGNLINKTVLLIGGENIVKQLKRLRSQPRLFVGTPGRVNDHLVRGSLKLTNTQFLVLDETDRMLDMGFREQVEEIVKSMPKKRQTFLFSATMPPMIVKFVNQYLYKPERITIGKASAPAENIKQDVVYVPEKEKYSQLLEQLDKRNGSVIVFVKTKRSAENIAIKLRKAKHYVDAIHGDLRHNKRASVIRAFRSQRCRIMVATDIAARGLDIPHIEHVINYDLPQCPEDYVHRIGRTARAGNSGEAVCFVTPHDKGKWRAIEKIANLNTSRKPKHKKRAKAG